MKEKTTKRTLLLGKVDYTGNGHADCPVELELELRRNGPQIISAPPEQAGNVAPYHTTDHREIETYTELSICGSIWQANRRDIYSGGQNIEEIAALFPERANVQRIAEIWQAWHLNGMTSGCVHQPEEWTCTHRPEEHDADIAALTAVIEALYERRAETSEISTAKYHLRWTEEVRALGHAEPVRNGWTVARQMQDAGKTAPPSISKLKSGVVPSKSYGFRGDSCVVCGRARWDEPSDACPETGYRYGTRWLVRSLPPEIEAEIIALFTKATAEA